MVRAPGIDRRFNNTAEEVNVRTAGILTGKLNISAQVARFLIARTALLNHLLRLHTQFVLHMNWTGGDKGVNTTRVRTG